MLPLCLQASAATDMTLQSILLPLCSYALYSYQSIVLYVTASFLCLYEGYSYACLSSCVPLKSHTSLYSFDL